MALAEEGNGRRPRQSRSVAKRYSQSGRRDAGSGVDDLGTWKEPDFTIMSTPAPPMIYDYSGFPEHTYHIQYSAPGSPVVAHRVQELLRAAGFAAPENDRRGFDHGVFAPLAAIYPKADVPVLQLSIRHDYDPSAHIEVGRTLAPSVVKEGVLIMGSGLSYHNLRLMGPQGKQPSQEFDAWLSDAVCGSVGEERNRKLQNWSNAPSATTGPPAGRPSYPFAGDGWNRRGRSRCPHLPRIHILRLHHGFQLTALKISADYAD